MSYMQQISDTPKLDLVKKCNNLWRDSYATNFWHSKTWLSEVKKCSNLDLEMILWSMQQISDTPNFDLVKKCNNLWSDLYVANFWHSKTWLSEKM